jgi:hypothetical protein
MNETRKQGVWSKAVAFGVCGLWLFGAVLTVSGQEGEKKVPGEKAPGEKAPAEKEKRGPGMKPGGPSGPGGPGGPGGKDRMGVDFTEAEMKRVREVLAEVWQDPGVLAAKEKVKLATDEYRDVLKAAVRRVDPEAEKLMAKMHELSRTMAMRREHDAHRKRMFAGVGPGGPLGLGLHEFLGRLSEEERKVFLAARETAEESEAVKAMREEMRSVEDPEERMRYMMRSRDLLLEEMVKVDARVKEMLPKLQPRGGRPNGGPGRPNGEPGEKGKAGEGNPKPARPTGE